MNRQQLRWAYVALDFGLSAGVWFGFWLIRRAYYEVAPPPFAFTLLEAAKHLGASLGWVALYALAGLYRVDLRRSRLRELVNLLHATLLGVVVLFFATFLNDQVGGVTALRELVLLYLLLQWVGVGLGRLALSSWVKAQLRRGRWYIPAVLVGGGSRAAQLWQDLQAMPETHGYRLLGYVADAPNPALPTALPHLAPLNELAQVLRQHRTQAVFLALEDADATYRLRSLLGACEGQGARLYTPPDAKDYLMGRVHMTGLRGLPLVELYPRLLSPWEAVAKRAMDVAVAATVLLLGAPVFLTLAAAVRLSSPGPVLYRQTRIGRGGKPFTILKYRSMVVEAEAAGPALSRDRDPRITPLGRFLRKTHLDELPQFWNVLKGDMALVGPRPERRHYIDQIVARAPEYHHLHAVRPGLTSWGQVKYGYAENVDQMLERMRYDLLYVDNPSLILDLKIMAYTVAEVLFAKGK